jgi:hypothetical protein
MAWFPAAERMELQPESDSQPAIVPTQLILHSIAAPWTPQRIFEYWRDSTNLESHFGLGYDGAIAQYVGTQTRADANMYANRRPDGTGACQHRDRVEPSAHRPVDGRAGRDADPPRRVDAPAARRAASHLPGLGRPRVRGASDVPAVVGRRHRVPG